MKAWLLALLLALMFTQTGCAFLAGVGVGAAAEEAADDDD